MAGVSGTIVQLQRQIVDYTNYLYNEEYLDGHFKMLQELQNESNPDFVVETVSFCLQDFQKDLHDITTSLHQQLVDIRRVEILAFKLKGGSSSIGAQRLVRTCILLLDKCKQRDIEGCFSCLQQVQHEYFLVKNKFETLFKLENQLVAAGGSRQ